MLGDRESIAESSGDLVEPDGPFQATLAYDLGGHRSRDSIRDEADGHLHQRAGGSS